MDSSPGLQGSSDDVLVVEDEIAEEETPWDIRGLMSKTTVVFLFCNEFKLYVRTMVYLSRLMIKLYQTWSRM